jgi:hypothetical protein
MRWILLLYCSIASTWFLLLRARIYYLRWQVRKSIRNAREQITSFDPPVYHTPIVKEQEEEVSGEVRRGFEVYAAQMEEGGIEESQDEREWKYEQDQLTKLRSR